MICTLFADIDECDGGPNSCDPISSFCVNTNGSYKCKCRTPCYHSNGDSCQLAKCPELILPDHVEIVGEKGVPCRTTYEFSCSPGYKLSGLSNITCFAGNWSDAPPSCVGQCWKTKRFSQ